VATQANVTRNDLSREILSWDCRCRFAVIGTFTDPIAIMNLAQRKSESAKLSVVVRIS
jgi:hypothetical protein